MSTAREVADVVLLSLVGPGASTAVIQAHPTEPGTVVVERGQQVIARAMLEPEIADAVIVRLALLADLDPVDSTGQLGRSTVRTGDVVHEVLVTTRRTGDTSSCEVRLLDTIGERASSSLTRGSRVGPYQIIRDLGHGGMGAVYLVEHKQLQKRFAMKVMLRSVFEEDPEAPARFICEARAAARGDHPNIVNVSDFGSLADGRAFLVMELLSGHSIADVLRADGPFELERALRLIDDAAEGLAAAHETGVIHRDLTPSNMFVEIDRQKRERLVLVDFGAAQMTDVDLADGSDQGDRAKIVFGTPYYMAPEHAQGRPTDERADIYSLGCCLYEMVTGKVPYGGQTVRQILLSHILDPVPELVGPAAERPYIRALVRRMLAKRPADRYHSATALSADIRMCLDELRAEAKR